MNHCVLIIILEREREGREREGREREGRERESRGKRVTRGNETKHTLLVSAVSMGSCSSSTLGRVVMSCLRLLSHDFNIVCAFSIALIKRTIK